MGSAKSPGRPDATGCRAPSAVAILSRPDAHIPPGSYTRYGQVTAGIMATGRTWAPRLKPYISTDMTGFLARLRGEPNVDCPSLPGSQSRGEGAVPHRDSPSARLTLPGPLPGRP